MLSAYEIPGTQFSLPATTEIKRYRFVSIDGTGQAIQANTTSNVIGVSRNEIDPVHLPEGQVLDIADGIMMVEASAAIACGAKVASTAEGKAVTAAGDTFVGVALSDAAAAGTIIAVKTNAISSVKGEDGPNYQTLLYTSADLDAGADLSDVPVGLAIGAGKLISASVISTGTAAGVDASNTSVFLVEVDSTSKAGFTFNNSDVFPSAGNAQELTITDGNVDAGDVLLLSVTNGSTANLPVFMVQLVVEID